MNASAAGKSPIREESLPSLLWWSGAGCDIEIDSQVLARLDGDTAAAYLLCGFSESNGEGGDFHVWECVRLPIESAEQFSIAALREFVISRENSMAMAPVGLWVPASWWPEPASAPPSMAGKTEMLPEHPILIRVDESRSAQTGVWHQGTGEVDVLPLHFPASYPVLAKGSYAPFQILNIRRGSHGSDYEPERAPVPPAPAPTVVAAKPDPKASGQVLRLEVPNWVWICGLVFAAGMLGTAIWYVMQRGTAVSTQPTAALAQPKLNLEVKQGDGGFDVRWDGSAVAALGAQSGVLHILDGGKRTEIALGYVALNSGKVLYIPQSNDIELLLTVYAPAGISQETVRIIRGSSPDQLTVASRARSVTPTAPVAQAAPPASKPTRTMQEPLPSTSRTPAPTETPRMADASDAPAVNPALGNRETKLEQVAALSTQAPPPTPTPTPTPQPAASKPQIGAPQTPQQTGPQTPTQAPAASKPVAQQPANGLPASQGAQPQARVPVIVPPSPTKQVTPVVPAHLRQLLPASAVVEVQVSVGADGTVTSAQAAPGYGVMVHLSRLAREAALKWKFDPATIDGKPVPGQHVLRFKFGR